MGFSHLTTNLILQEHRYKPIAGRVLMIGRQNTGLTEPDLDRLLGRYGIPKRKVALEIDQSTIHLTDKAGPHITDVSFFHAFADCRVEALDIGPYEGAEIIHDMSTPVPPELRGQFDFIFDGSSLDNIFDTSTAMRNMHEMLKPGGRIVMINYSNSFPTAYAKLSPDWYMDFFAFHEYDDAKVFVVTSEIGSGTGQLWQYDPWVVYSGQDGYECSGITTGGQQTVVCLAERGTAPSKAGNPVQMHYRGENTEPYLSSARRFRSSKRVFDYLFAGLVTDCERCSPFPTMKLLADNDKARRAKVLKSSESLRQADLPTVG